jgi:hypothetical protein
LYDTIVETRGDIDHPQYIHFMTRNENFEIRPKDIQISKIRWVPDKKSWEGIYSQYNPFSKNTLPAVMKLTSKWVEDNFKPNMIEAFKKNAIEGQKQFLQVPVGDIIVVKPMMDISLNPAILYRNNESAVCGFASFASAIHFLGFEMEAKEIFGLSVQYEESQELVNALTYIVNKVHKVDSFLTIRKKYQVKSLQRGFNPVEGFGISYCSNDILMIVLHQSDNNCSHLVSVTGNYIFDCNVDNPLPLSIEAFDCSC